MSSSFSKVMDSENNRTVVVVVSGNNSSKKGTVYNAVRRKQTCSLTDFFMDYSITTTAIREAQLRPLRLLKVNSNFF